MKLLQTNDSYFVFDCQFSEKDIAKAAGFRWNPINRHWFTSEISVAANLRDYADSELAQLLSGVTAIAPPALPDTPALTQQDNRFVFISKPEFKDIAKQAGFWWDPLKRYWYTSNSQFGN